MRLGWVQGAGAALALLVAVQGVGCEPQEILLFEPVSPPGVDSGVSGISGAGGSAEGPEPAAAPSQPACESEACEECLSRATPCRADANLFCHPRTGECALGCDPEAQEEARVCPSNQVCHPVDGLCVGCVTSLDCGSTPGLVACDEQRGSCVECTASSECPLSRPVCDTQAQRCFECLPDEGCGDPEVCHPTRLQCVECVTVADCTDSDDRFCEDSRCVECRTDADCAAAEPDKPFCSPELECEDDD